MKYIDADKLRAEIERRMETCDANSKTPDQLLWAELGALIAFLDTLEEPDKNLEEAAIDFADYARKQPKEYAIFAIADYDHGCIDGFKAGAEWQEKRWENNRLMAQDNATEEECQREMDFVDNHIKKHHRIPTFSDAINYGIDWQKKQMPLPEDTLIFRKGVEEGKRLMMEEAVEGSCIDDLTAGSVIDTEYGVLYLPPDKFCVGDKVKIIIIKEDGQ